MAELAQLPRPVMCRSARLHSDHGRRQLGKKRQHLAAPQLPAQHRPLGGINPMQLKNMLRRIHSNSDNLVHGRLPCLRLQQPHSGTLDAVGGRPHHHAARILAMKRAISWVAELCCCTALAIVEAMLEIWAMVPPISLMAATDSCVAPCMPRMCEDISSVAFAVWLASDLTSEATTAKPLPASPARAASMVALSARRLVCSAIAVISLTTSPISCAARDSFPMRSSVASAWATAASAMRLDSLTWRPIWPTEVDSSSVAVATESMLPEVSSDAPATLLDRPWVV